MRLYQSLARSSNDDMLGHNSRALYGYMCGNHRQPGCLTSNPNVRIHSCEIGMKCATLETSNVVWIKPIITDSSFEENVFQTVSGGDEKGFTPSHARCLNKGKPVVELSNICIDKFKDHKSRSNLVELILKKLNSPEETTSLTTTNDADDGLTTFQKMTPLMLKIISSEDYLLREGNNHSSYKAKDVVEEKMLTQEIVRNPLSIAPGKRLILFNSAFHIQDIHHMKSCAI